MQWGLATSNLPKNQGVIVYRYLTKEDLPKNQDIIMQKKNCQQQIMYRQLTNER